MSNYQYDDISFASLKRDIEGYSWATFRQDLFAGFSVSLITMPQAMAFALVAGLPLSCGLLAAIFPAILAAAFGSSRHLVVGPNNATAILVQYGTSEILYTFYRDVSGTQREMLALQILTQLTLLVGFFQFLAAVFKLGRLTQFVSHSVVVGYLGGTALAVVVNQLFTFFGLNAPPQAYSLYEKGTFILTHLKDIHIPTFLVGLGSISFLLIIKRLHPKIPAGVVMLIVAGLAVHFLGLSSYSPTGLLGFDTKVHTTTVAIVGDTGEVQDIVPVISRPFFDSAILNNLLPVAFAIALLTTLETTSVAKALAATTGQRLRVNQEIFGLGLANLLSSFIGALPCCGSPSRSSLNLHEGGKTRFSAIYSAICVGLIVMIFSFFVTRTPLAALSAILLVSSINIVNFKQFFLCLKATRSDAMVLIATLLSCIFLSLDIAFYIGIVISITLYLKKAAVPHLIECTFDESGRLGSLDSAKKREHKLIRVINVQGELFFGAADIFQSTLKSIAEDDTTTKVIILRLKNARDIDATACLALQQLNDYLKGSGRFLLACGLTYPSWHVLCDSGIVEQMGKDNLFILDEKNPHLSLQKAIQRAKELIADRGKAPSESRRTISAYLSNPENKKAGDEEYVELLAK